MPNGMFSSVKRLKTDSKEVEGGRRMRGSNGKLCFSEKEGGSLEGSLERIMNEENDRDHNVEGDAVEGPAVCVDKERLQQALNQNKKNHWTFRSIIGVDCR